MNQIFPATEVEGLRMGSAAEKPLSGTEAGWDGIEIGLWPHTVYFFQRNVQVLLEAEEGEATWREEPASLI